MTCRDIPTGGAASYDTIQQMYVGLGIRRLPTGVHMNVDGNLPASGLNTAVLTPEAVACFNTFAGITGGSAYNNSAMHSNVRDLRQLIDYFRGAGNTGDANIITGEEIDAYVTAYGEGRENFNAQEYRDLTVSNIAAYLAIVQYMGGGDAGSVPTIAAPQDSISAAVRTYGSVQQMYTGLIGDVTAGANATRSSVAEDVPPEGIPLGVLNQTNIQAFGRAIGWTEGEPNSPLARNARDILTLVDYFRGDGNLEGGDANVITSNEIDAYVRAYVENARAGGDTNITFDNYRPVVIGNLRAIVGCVQYISNPPTLTIAPPADAGAPDAGAPPVVVDAGTGPRVTAETRDAGTGGTGGAPNNGHQDSGLNLPSWLVPALGALGLGSITTYLVMRNRGTPPPANGGNNPPAATRKGPAPTGGDGNDARTDRRSSNPPPPPAAKAAPAAANNPPAARLPVDDDMNDVLNDLTAAKAQQTPQGGAISGAPAAAASAVTADNVIINGNSAAPVSGVDSAVVRSQVVLHFRRFLSQAARDALQDGRALPSGTELVNSSFEREVNEITDRIVAEYYTRNGTTDGREGLSDLWRSQLEDRGYIVRRGVPQRMLLEVANAYIAEHSSSASSPLAGGVGTEMTREAERHAGESRFLEDGMREIMRMSGR